MEKVNYTQEDAKKAYLTGHYDFMTQALAVAVNRVPAWRLAKDFTPCPLFDVFGFAKRWDEEHPRKEGDPGFYYVTREGAIGYSASGLEYQIRWIFIPMEPGEERDAIVQATVDAYNKAEQELAAAQKAAEAKAAEAKEKAVQPAPEGPAVHFCKWCGKALKNPNARFCPHCGGQVQE